MKRTLAVARYSTAFLVGALVLGLAPQAVGEAAGDGWVIVVDAAAVPAERYAADELVRFVEQATGMRMPVVERPTRRARVIYVGDGVAFRRSRLAFDVSGFGDEEFRIRVQDDAVAIVGGRPRGTLYGVYQFLEDYVGVRFLTADHTYVPGAPELRLPVVDRRYKPAFSYRWSYYKEASAFPEFAVRCRINTLTPDEKYGGVTGESQEAHSLQYQVPVAKYGAAHPEYFALVDGVRLLHLPDGAPQLCSTNPAVADIVTQAALEELDAHPGRTEVSVTTNDNDRYCTCPDCSAINAREGSPMGAHLTLVNTVAERLERFRPGVKVLTLAYWYTLKPPQHLRPRPNVQVCVCSFEACGLHRLDDPACPRNAAFMKGFDGWGAICPDLRFWYYNTDLRYLDLPYPNLDSLGPNLRMARDRGVHGLFMQGNERCFAGEMSDLRNYLTCRLMWNPDLDLESVRDEFLRLHYGRAATPIAEYLRLARDHAEAQGAHPHCWAEPRALGLDEPFARRVAALFDEALTMADDDTVRSRVEKASICAYKPLFETAGRLAYDHGIVHAVYPRDVLERVKRYRELCRRFGMDRNSELDSVDDYLASLRNQVGGAPGARVEDATWRVTAIPAFNGEVVDLYHKPRGTQYLDAWDHAGVNLPRGTLHVWGLKGYNHLSPMGFQAKVARGVLVMAKRMEDGSTVTRTITLRSGARPEVVFDTAIQHHGATPRTYQFVVGAELGRWPASPGLVPPEVTQDAAPSSPLGWLTIGGGSVGLGARIWYDSGQFAEPSMAYRTELGDAELALPTHAVSLGKGGLYRARLGLAPLQRPKPRYEGRQPSGTGNHRRLADPVAR